MPADIRCIRCGESFPQSGYPRNRASATGFSLACGSCLSSLRTGPVETALALVRRSFNRLLSDDANSGDYA